jgi:probable phosphoglycerate mutase
VTAAIDRLTLHLVRHGETAGNAERRFQQPDVPLSDLGREQAAAVAETIASTTAAAVILASDYARTMETATIISARIGLPIVQEPALRERSWGIHRGRLYSEFDEATFALWRTWDHRIEGGESWADVHVRVEGLLDRLAQQPPAAELILVTHGGAMNVMLHHLGGGAGETFTLQPLENCALRTVEIACSPHR